MKHRLVFFVLTAALLLTNTAPLWGGFGIGLACGRPAPLPLKGLGEASHPVRGTVQDNITGKGLAAKITLMTADSVVIDTTTAKVMTNPYTARTFAEYNFEKGVSRVGRYIIKAEADGYETKYVGFRLVSNREQEIRLDAIIMQRAWQELPEVMVKATKVKMVMHGDTIVYNADAFNLAEGSMLDALVARLPGTRLTKDGRIYVNGRYVESLLINGHDFFDGNAKLALDNLPAYTVSKIKVYNKAGNASVVMGRDMGDKQYVMDVRLKKEYAQGFMGNVDAGAGTNNRYSLHALGLDFSENKRIMAFANLNNLNENQQPDLTGDWSPQDIPEGLIATKTVGVAGVRLFGGSGADQMNKWLSGGAIYTHTGADNETRQSSQTFLPGGDTFGSSFSKLMNSSDAWNGALQFNWAEPGRATIDFLRVDYVSRKGWGSGNADLSADTLLNSSVTANSADTKDFSASFESQNVLRVFAVDMLRFNFKAKYDRLKQQSYDVNDVRYMQGDRARDYRNNYVNAPHQDLSLTGDLSYTLKLRDLDIIPLYSYTYTYNKTHSLRYRLDRLADRDSSRFDVLPSAVGALAAVPDDANSYRFREYRNEHSFFLNAHSFNIKPLNAEMLVNIPVRIVSSNLYYHRLGRHDVSRHATFFEPFVSLEHWGDHVDWKFEAKVEGDVPDLTTMVDYRDDSDPLNIRLGNADLKNIHRYSLSASTLLHGDHQRAVRLWADWHKTDNAVAYGIAFDRTTGVTTTQPVSINGNWDVNGGIGFARALDKAEKLTTDNDFYVNYNHNVDLASSAGVAPERSIVNNYKFGGNVKLNYRPNDSYDFTVHGGGNYNIIRSHRAGFDNINAGDYNVGFNVTANVFWHLQLSTDMTMFARRGYQQAEMNTTDWVWNAQLSRSFLKGRLVARLQGFDILHQLATTQYIVNAQGRTEAWHNSIPRYAMLSLAWHFNHNPKNIQLGF